MALSGAGNGSARVARFAPCAIFSRSIDPKLCPALNAAIPTALADTDQQLVERCQTGDQRAFELLMVKYQRRVERLIARWVRDVDMVPDIAQETFIRAYRALPGFRGEAQFYTWLYRIAINTAKRHLMNEKGNPLVYESSRAQPSEEDETFFAQPELSNDETPEAVLASRQIADAVHQALAALPDDLRQALVLREMDGLNYEEIAQTMNCPVGTVRSRIFRAREAISKKIKPMLDKQTGKRW
jgi:RNA polymerase sigma-70 factor, ECF subfamily